MSEKKGLLLKRFFGVPDTIVKERLSGTNTDLTSFSIHYGANIYVFSYEKEGVRRHTLIDTGDVYYRNQILPILAENDINPANIERVIITHSHADHYGLAALLAKESKAKILVHPNFKNFIEGEVAKEERRWVNERELSRLKECDIEYLPQSDRSELISISGVDFPSLGKPIEIGEGGRLEILACPESTQTHTPDQIIIIYSPRSRPHTYEKKHENFLSTDDILFSGDLWLMVGPPLGSSIRAIFRHIRFRLFRLKNLISGNNMDPRKQDAEAKEALKNSFTLIRVKPAHGEEFIGSRIIPHGLLADRDLLKGLGYPLNARNSILRRTNLAPRIAALMEQAYTSFVEELLFWRELRYTPDEISELLVRIYKEQSGGRSVVQRDRKQRRERLKETLARLKDDKAKSEELHQLAQSTLLKLEGVL